MRNLLLTLRFDGQHYHGWQVQPNALTVQEVFQNAVERVLKVREGVTGCSRTDSGVHANMFCCHMKTSHLIEPAHLIPALNAVLPLDIAVTDCREVPLDFHARYDCKSKEYIYKIWNHPIRDPFLQHHALHYKARLDADDLHRAAQAFLGQHDYKGFSNAGSKMEDTRRTVKRIQITREGDLVIFAVEADGFLYNMVRIMVGTLLCIAQGKIDKGSLPSIVAGGRREAAGFTAKAHGLYLNRVRY